MRTLLILSAVLILLTSFSASADRWEYIDHITTNEGEKIFYYLDVTTVSRPDKNSVIYWSRSDRPDGISVRDRVVMKRDRTYGYLHFGASGRSVPMQDVEFRYIPPDSMVEGFYERLFR